MSALPFIALCFSAIYSTGLFWRADMALSSQLMLRLKEITRQFRPPFHTYEMGQHISLGTQRHLYLLLLNSLLSSRLLPQNLTFLRRFLTLLEHHLRRQNALAVLIVTRLMGFWLLMLAAYLCVHVLLPMEGSNASDMQLLFSSVGILMPGFLWSTFHYLWREDFFFTPSGFTREGWRFLRVLTQLEKDQKDKMEKYLRDLQQHYLTRHRQLRDRLPFFELPSYIFAACGLFGTELLARF